MAAWLGTKAEGRGGGRGDKRLYGAYIVQINSFDCHLNQIPLFLYSQDWGVTG